MLFQTLAEVPDPLPHDGPLNMAIDEVLLRGAHTPLLRFYSWSRPALSFGYFGRWEQALEAACGREVVRRWTGGGMVPHGADLTYTLIVPRSHPFAARPPLESYQAIHAVVAAILDGASLAAGDAPGDSCACFESPVRHDVLRQGQKVAGAAQRRTRFGLLHQGSIQLPGPTAQLARSLAAAFAANLVQMPLPEAVLAEAQALAQAKYATAAWLQRR